MTSVHDAVARWEERADAIPELSRARTDLPTPLRGELPRVIAASEFVATALLQDPPCLEWLVGHHDPAAARLASAHYEDRAASASMAAETEQLLREWRRRVMCRAAWRDIAGRADVVETLTAVSDLADACIRAASAAAQKHLDMSFGRPRNEAGGEVPFIVVAMGKLGGRELNFSSDVDLVFLYGEGGRTDGLHTLDNAEYFQRVGREVIRLLHTRTHDGFVFRVDMRLRPFGESGALVVSLEALESYLLEHGRDWERYAWIKARPVVGFEAYAAAADDSIRPFVYRRYLDFGVFESLRDMKALIAREVGRRELHQHLKLGPGGIRELEFIVQSLQLVRGGSDRRLQSPSLLDVLPLLRGSKLLSAMEVKTLLGAYLVLRKAENALQMIRDEQTHVLPADALDQSRVCLQLGMPDWPSALESIEGARREVARIFEALVFGEPDSKRSDGEAILDGSETDARDVAAQLVQFGFAADDLEPLTSLLMEYRRSASYRRLDEGARRRLRVIVTRLLRSTAARPSPRVIVERVWRVLEAIGARSSYLALLKEQPPALNRLIDVCALSGFLARQIAEFPLLLDELLDPNVFDELPSREGFANEMAVRTERLPASDPERQVEALRQSQKASVFNVAFADLSGRLPLMKVSDRLTDIAELIVARCLSLAWDQLIGAHGAPHCIDGEGKSRAVTVAVAGYGKLGGWELGYGSDLDLLFLHDSSGELQQTSGERPVDNAVFFLRLGQRIVHLLTMHSAAGRLYEVDMRLRPNGKGGFLMTGIDSFERYQRQDAWTWEHQALLRARSVAGDPALCARFERVRRTVLQEAVHRDTLRADVADMRQRMRRELSLAHSGQFDIKQDAGGIADIEFMVQYWVLQSCGAHPALLDHTDNIRQLEGLARDGVLCAETARWIKEAYIGYRLVLHRLSLEGGERVVDAAPHASTRARVTELWRSTFEAPGMMTVWSGPYGGVPPLDRVDVADFLPTLEAAMQEKLREVERIASNPDAPTFDNTLLALERAGHSFDRANAVYEIWSASMNTGGFQAVEREMGPKIAGFHDAITQNNALFARIGELFHQGVQATAQRQRLCWHYHSTFIRAGARLDPIQKDRIAAINARLAGLFARFGQNLLADESTHALCSGDRADFAGLSTAQCEAAATAAAQLGRPGEWAILNTRSAVEPFLTYSERRDLRESVWRTFYNRGNNGGLHDNKAIIREILALRRDRAQLLGYPSHAHWRLADSMAGDPEKATALMMRLWPIAVRRVRQEVDSMQAMADHFSPGIRIEAWDYRFYAEKVRQATFDLDMNEVKPYLQLENLREGMFWLADRLYGFKFCAVSGIPVHHPDVRVWEVQSASGDHVGLWYFDPFARPGKNSGAWMSEYREQSRLNGRTSPIVSNNTNFMRSSGAPVLISWEDAVTLFHEFGHALHTLNSDVEYPSLSGTRVVRDFVEFPSQLHENWLATPELLSRFALHHETGESLPGELIAKIKAARTFNQGFATVEYLAAALIDMKLHLAREPVLDPEAFERDTLSELGMPPEVVMRHRTPQFAHIFAGDSYSAGYYSYLWAEVLDHDAFGAFVESGDFFDRTVAKRLRDDIMSVGNSIDPAQAYRNFRGRDPAIGALLSARGFNRES